MNDISIFGTSSDAGKSTITFVIAKLLQEKGIKVTPFKAQNVSNNAKVADDNSEIAVAQYFQAKEILNLKTSYHINPVLLKSGRGSSSSLIVEGKAIEEKDVRSYYRDLDRLKPIVKRNFEELKKSFDIVVAEGAGSPVELNLMDKDLSNIFIAKTFNTKIILVADIQKGGVFASIYGVYHLLPKELQKNVIGVIVNKFQGDKSLFDEGVKIIENEFGLRVFGVLPFHPLNLGFEDSASLLNYTQNKTSSKIKVAVIKYPTMSNYNDFEPLLCDSELDVEFIFGDISLDSFDMVVLPGSKLTIDDLRWLKRVGLDKRIKSFIGIVFGICGGFEKLCKRVGDEEGLGLIDDEIEFKKKKILNRGSYTIFGIEVEGFELHEGQAKKYSLFYQEKNIYATFVHEVFDSDRMREFIFKKIDSTYKGYNFKEYKEQKIEEFMSIMKENLDVKGLISCILS
jgi:adenosylcobyric acid synthase